ncbi:uncharacterized protein LOC135834589 isoform X2 [Planococcus citri]|uniref:uncharacterized protein LOC135834589 isoform X2 n=1 Tax=Planococcus citri TaxID=170843 RepID=UPI0031F90D2C
MSKSFEEDLIWIGIYILILILLAFNDECFPKLKQCFYHCSLRTGMFYICWISLLWDVFFILYNEVEHVEKDPADVPYLLRFLDGQKMICLNPSLHPFSPYCRLYYWMEIIEFTVGLIGIYFNSWWILFLQLVSETCILLIYVFMTLYKLRVGSNFIDLICSFLIIAFKCYLYLIIMNFCSEVVEGRDGSGLRGIIIVRAAVPSPSAPASAPSVTEHTIPAASRIDSPYAAVPSPYAQASAPSVTEHTILAASRIDSPYAIQPPPIFTQPCTPISPPVVQTDVVDPDAPPPYSIVMNEDEEPPPYADLYI